MSNAPHPGQELPDAFRRHAADHPKLKMIVVEWSDELQADRPAWGHAVDRLQQLLSLTDCRGLERMAATALGDRDIWLYAQPGDYESAPAFLALTEYAGGRKWLRELTDHAATVRPWGTHTKIPGCRIVAVPGPAGLLGVLLLERQHNNGGQAEAAGEAATPPWHIGDVNRCLEALEAHQGDGFDIWQSAKELAEQIPQGVSAVLKSMFWKGCPDEKGTLRSGIIQRRQEERRQRRDLKSHSELT